MKDLVEYRIPSLTNDDLFERPPGKLNDEEILVIWSYFDLISKKCEKRKKSLRNSMLARAEENGLEDENGSRHYGLLGGKVSRTIRRSVKADPHKIEKLLKDKDIPLSKAGDLQFVVDDDKLSKLLVEGLITVEELEECISEKVTHALNVTKPPALVEEVERNVEFIRVQQGLLREE